MLIEDGEKSSVFLAIAFKVLNNIRNITNKNCCKVYYVVSMDGKIQPLPPAVSEGHVT